MTVRTNWVGKQYGMINGAPTFVTVVGRTGEPHAVRLTLPKNWSRSATSLKALGDQPHTFVAENFDELVDSPIVAGNVQVYPFNAGGVEHQLVNIGESGYWDGTKAARDLKRIVEAHQKMWGTVPYDRYLFLNMIAETGGGLEHDNSTVLMTSRWSFRDRSRYTSWLSLASHEFFHTWNVRRLRPKPLVKYDYENEVYTDGLWIAEGITSYYEDLALVRAGLISRNEYLSRLSQNVESVQRTDGRKVQSLRDSSYDTWIKFYRPDENSSNTRISYYSKGAVVAFLLDAKVRKLTKGEKSLDDIMKQMFKKYSKSGFTSEQFRDTASDIAGEDLSDWFASVIDSTDELDYSDIEELGIVVPNKQPTPKVEPAKKQGGAASRLAQLMSALTEKKETRTRPTPTRQTFSLPKQPYIGMRTTTSEGKVTISSVKRDSPASEAGLNIDDEVIALNDFRITSSVDRRLQQYEIGDEIELLIARRGQLMTFRVEIGSQEFESWRLRYTSKPSAEQRKQLNRWLSETPDSSSKKRTRRTRN